MRILPRLLAAILPVAFAAVGIAFAASLAVTSNALGAGTASTPRCTTAGLTVVQNLSGSNVASVTVGALPAGCANASILVTVNNGSAQGSGTSTVPAGGGSVTVTLASTPAVTAAETIDLVVVGP